MTALPRSRRRLVLAAGLFLAAAILAQVLRPTAVGIELGGRRLPDLCPWAGAGAACPGCGTTRALLHLLRGEPAEAWRLQPAVFLFGFAPLAGRRRTALVLAGAAVALLRFFSG
ncbi:MAG: DUF2752 domain-containing protein [Planctomycetota bacterium]|nr:MAG: DUF2752 domain-containing protein [Planctomycetota bacterium]